jgi:hypothetical protein
MGEAPSEQSVTAGACQRTGTPICKLRPGRGQGTTNHSIRMGGRPHSVRPSTAVTPLSGLARPRFVRTEKELQPQWPAGGCRRNETTHLSGCTSGFDGLKGRFHVPCLASQSCRRLQRAVAVVIKPSIAQSHPEFEGAVVLPRSVGRRAVISHRVTRRKPVGLCRTTRSRGKTLSAGFMKPLFQHTVT